MPAGTRASECDVLMESIFGAILDEVGNPEKPARDGEARAIGFLLDTRRMVREKYKATCWTLAAEGTRCAADFRAATENVASPVCGPQSRLEDSKREVFAYLDILDECIAFASNLVRGLQLLNEIRRSAVEERHILTAEIVHTKGILDSMPVPLSFLNDWERFDAAANMVSVH